MENAISKPSQRTYTRLFWIFLTATTLFRMAIAGKFGLGVDESHYLFFSRHLAWGYFDHPPMVAFLAALTTLLGEGIIFVRLGPILCSAISLVLLRFLALSLYKDERVAFWATVLFAIMPYQHLLMVGLLPDSTLNLFWCGTLLSSWHAMRDGRWPAWILTGVLFGGALLSKYHAVLLPACLLCYLCASPGRRYWLGRMQPYVAGVIGLILFMPNVIWNAQHDWISYAYQLTSRGEGQVSLIGLLGAFGGQMAVWSPVIFGLLIAAYIVLAKERPLSESTRFVIWTSLPVFVFFCAMGAFGKVLPHWTSIGWWTGSLAVVKVVLEKFARRDKTGIRWYRWSIAAAITGLAMISFMYVALIHPVVQPIYSEVRNISLRLNQFFPAMKPLKPFETKYDISNTLFGWDQVGKKVEAARAEMPHQERTFVFCQRFFTASLLTVYLHPETTVTTLHQEFNQYRFWFTPQVHTGWDALFVNDTRYFQGYERYLPLFDRIDPKPDEIRVFRNGQLARVLNVYRCYGFKGEFEGDQGVETK